MGNLLSFYPKMHSLRAHPRNLAASLTVIGESKSGGEGWADTAILAWLMADYSRYDVPAAVTVCTLSCMVYVYSTVKRKLQRGNAARDARIWKVGDSASPAVLIRTSRLISRVAVFRIGGEEIRNCGRVHAWNPSLRKWWDVEYGRSVDSTSSRNFGRKFPVRSHPARP